MNDIEMILLGLLHEKDLYAYEIESIIDFRCIRDWTDIGFSSIYNSLNKLEKKGFIKSRYEKEFGSPRRKVYSVCEEIKEPFKEEVYELISKYNRDSSKLDIGMAFSYLLEEKNVIKALQMRLSEMKKIIKWIEDKYEKHYSHENKMMIKPIFTRPMMSIQCEMEFIGNLLQKMRGEEDE